MSTDAFANNISPGPVTFACPAIITDHDGYFSTATGQSCDVERWNQVYLCAFCLLYQDASQNYALSAQDFSCYTSGGSVNQADERKSAEQSFGHTLDGASGVDHEISPRGLARRHQAKVSGSHRHPSNQDQGNMILE